MALAAVMTLIKLMSLQIIPLKVISSGIYKPVHKSLKASQRSLALFLSGF
jgi:hypothetical protein